VFKDYGQEIYKTKCNPINNSQKVMAKSLLNNLLGKFGIGLEKAITKIISKEKYCEITKISVTTWKKHWEIILLIISII